MALTDTHLEYQKRIGSRATQTRSRRGGHGVLADVERSGGMGWLRDTCIAVVGVVAWNSYCPCGCPCQPRLRAGLRRSLDQRTHTPFESAGPNPKDQNKVPMTGMKAAGESMRCRVDRSDSTRKSAVGAAYGEVPRRLPAISWEHLGQSAGFIPQRPTETRNGEI